MAVRVGFEPTDVLPPTVFKTAAITQTRPSHQIPLLVGAKRILPYLLLENAASHITKANDYVLQMWLSFKDCSKVDRVNTNKSSIVLRAYR